jgi:hypothetical protein
VDCGGSLMYVRAWPGSTRLSPEALQLRLVVRVAVSTRYTVRPHLLRSPMKPQCPLRGHQRVPYAPRSFIRPGQFAVPFAHDSQVDERGRISLRRESPPLVLPHGAHEAGLHQNESLQFVRANAAALQLVLLEAW